MKFNVWTLLFQITNFIVLLVILKRVLYKPVRDIMEQRRDSTARELRNAEHAKSEAKALKEKYQAELNGLEGQKVHMLESAQEGAGEERKRLINKAREDADAIIARGKALEIAEKRTFEAEMKEKVLDSVSVFSSNLMNDLADETLHDAVFRRFIAGLERALPEHPSTAGEAGAVSVELASAYPLRDRDIDRIKDVIRSRIGGQIAVSSVSDPTLIAGVRMKIGDQIIDSSIAGQIRALKDKLHGAA